MVNSPLFFANSILLHSSSEITNIGCNVKSYKNNGIMIFNIPIVSEAISDIAEDYINPLVRKFSDFKL